MKTGELLCVSRDLPQWKMILTFDEHRWHMQEFITEEEIAKAKHPSVVQFDRRPDKVRAEVEGTPGAGSFEGQWENRI